MLFILQLIQKKKMKKIPTPLFHIKGFDENGLMHQTVIRSIYVKKIINVIKKVTERRNVCIFQIPEMRQKLLRQVLQCTHNTQLPRFTPKNRDQRRYFFCLLFLQSLSIPRKNFCIFLYQYVLTEKQNYEWDIRQYY